MEGFEILKNKKTSEIIAHRVLRAKTYRERLRGLLGYKHFERHKALWIYPCTSVHTFFMAFPIDVLFVNKGLIVKSIFKEISAWNILGPVSEAFSVFEFYGGVLKEKNINIGDELDVVS